MKQSWVLFHFVEIYQSLSSNVMGTRTQSSSKVFEIRLIIAAYYQAICLPNQHSDFSLTCNKNLFLRESIKFEKKSYNSPHGRTLSLADINL